MNPYQATLKSILLKSQGGPKKALYDARYFKTASFQEGIEKIISNPNYVFIGWEGKVAMEAVGTCVLQSVPYYSGKLVFYARKQYPYLEVINHQ